MREKERHDDQRLEAPGVPQGVGLDRPRPVRSGGPDRQEKDRKECSQTHMGASMITRSCLTTAAVASVSVPIVTGIRSRHPTAAACS
jgi:hypothetical protein